MIYTLPVIGALIGWLTNYIAVKMLFHPREEKRLLFLRLQGVFPKRQKEFAKKVGEVVSKEFFSVEEVRQALRSKAHSGQIKRIVEAYIEKVLSERLSGIIPMLAVKLPYRFVAKIKEIFLEELGGVVESVVDNISDDLEDVLDVQQAVEERVASFSSERLEQISFEIMRNEFRFVELVGAVLGFVIGLVQVVLLQLV